MISRSVFFVHVHLVNIEKKKEKKEKKKEKTKQNKINMDISVTNKYMQFEV